MFTLKEDKFIDQKLIAKIQHLYDFLKKRKNREIENVDIERLALEQELDAFIAEFEKVFQDVLYTE